MILVQGIEMLYRTSRRIALGIALLSVVSWMVATSAQGNNPPNKSTPVVEGVGWGAVRIGASRAEAVAALGTPDAGSDERALRWDSRHHVQCRLDGRGGQVMSVFFNKGFEGRTKRGIALGDSIDRVLAASGGALKTVEATSEETHGVRLGRDRVLYKQMAKGQVTGIKFMDAKAGILYWCNKDGIVHQMVVFPPAATETRQAVGGKADDSLRRKQQVKARERMKRDSEIYSETEVREIESLYQVANRNWRTTEARESLRTLVQKYKKANRTGCAILYLGQMSEGDEQIAYFKQAIADYDDCFYGDGVQVGAYARFLLGQAYLKAGDTDKAKSLFAEIRRDYPDAVDHPGRSLVEQLPK